MVVVFIVVLDMLCINRIERRIEKTADLEDSAPDYRVQFFQNAPDLASRHVLRVL